MGPYTILAMVTLAPALVALAIALDAPQWSWPLGVVLFFVLVKSVQAIEQHMRR